MKKPSRLVTILTLTIATIVLASSSTISLAKTLYQVTAYAWPCQTNGFSSQSPIPCEAQQVPNSFCLPYSDYSAVDNNGDRYVDYQNACSTLNSRSNKFTFVPSPLKPGTSKQSGITYTDFAFQCYSWSYNLVYNNVIYEADQNRFACLPTPTCEKAGGHFEPSRQAGHYGICSAGYKRAYNYYFTDSNGYNQGPFDLDTPMSYASEMCCLPDTSSQANISQQRVVSTNTKKASKPASQPLIKTIKPTISAHVYNKFLKLINR